MNAFLDQPLVVPLVATVALFAVAAALRLLIGRRIRRDAVVLDEEQRRQLFYLRSALTAGVFIGLLAIWLGRLENALLSVTAFAVALVIAIKELLMCVSGFLLRTTGRLFSIGDWIECHGLRGEVTDHRMLSTTVLEVEPPENGHSYTGRTLTLPNSMFLTHPVCTAAFGRRYTLHRVRITTEGPVDAVTAIGWLQERAQSLSAPFREEAVRKREALTRELGVDIPGAEPEVTVSTTDLGRPQFQVLLFCPTPQAAALERDLTAEFLAALQRGDIAAGAPGGPVADPA